MSLSPFVLNLAAYSAQLMLLALAAGGLARVMRLRSPRAMLAYWQGALVLGLALPLVQPWRSSADPARGFFSWEVGAGGRPEALERIDLGAVLAAVLAGGGLLRLGWLVRELRRVGRYRKRARPLDPLPAAVAGLADRLGVRAGFYASDDVTAPATFGHRRPVVLLPVAFLRMSAEVQRAVVAHELVHVRRRDWTLTVAEEAVRSVLWFHPAVHWLVGRIRLCREQVVDHEVAGPLADRRAYLDALLEVARGLAGARPLSAALMLREGHLKSRIELLLEEVNMTRTRIAASLTLGVAALTAAAAAAAWSFPLHAVPFAAAYGAGGEGTKRLAERKVVSRVNPVYPEEAKRDGVEGSVVLAVVIEKSGEVSKATATEGPEPLRDAAVSAVRQWRFETSDVGPVNATITVRFALDKEKVKAKAKAKAKAKNND